VAKSSRRFRDDEVDIKTALSAPVAAACRLPGCYACSIAFWVSFDHRLSQEIGLTESASGRCVWRLFERGKKRRN